MNFWLARNINLATRIQKSASKGRYKQMRYLWSPNDNGFLAPHSLVPLQKTWGRPPTAAVIFKFFICGSYKNLSLGIHEIDWVSSSMVFWCFVDIVGFLMMNILVIMWTSGTYWLYMLHTNLVMLGFLMFFTLVLLINMKLEFDVCFVHYT